MAVLLLFLGYSIIQVCHFNLPLANYVGIDNTPETYQFHISKFIMPMTLLQILANLEKTFPVKPSGLFL